MRWMRTPILLARGRGSSMARNSWLISFIPVCFHGRGPQVRISGWSSKQPDPTELLPANPMKPLEQKTCSSCGESFACGAERVEERCWCDHLPHVSLVANEDR